MIKCHIPHGVRTRALELYLLVKFPLMYLQKHFTVHFQPLVPLKEVLRGLALRKVKTMHLPLSPSKSQQHQRKLWRGMYIWRGKLWQSSPIARTDLGMEEVVVVAIQAGGTTLEEVI